WISINEFWYYFTLTYGVALAILVIYIYYEGNLHLTPNFLFLSKPLFKQMLSFGLFIMFGGAASMVVNKIDTIMISYLTNLKETAVYALALYIATIIETPKRVLNQLTDPLVANAWKDDDINTIHALYQKTSLNQLIVGCLLFMLLWLNIDQIFSIIPKSEIYKEGKFVILFIGLAKLVDMVTGNNGEIIGYSKHYRFGLYSIIFLAGLTILTNYIFIPIYGINGAAFATFLSTSLFNIIKFTFLKFKFNLQPFTTRTLKVLIISTTTYLIVAHIPETEIIIFDLLINSTLIFFLFLVPIIYLRISPDITEMVEQKLKFLNFKKK
ncbi:MAG TPA: polysaccharide biosynthesis C-terminal domain-containing protein, partial [Cytophagaceae bacterium]